MRLAHAIVNSAPTLPRRINPLIASGLQAVILRALEKKPSRRYQSASEMAAALRGSSGLSALRLVRARRMLWTTSVVLAIGLAATLLAVFAPLGKPRDPGGSAAQLRIGVVLPQVPQAGVDATWPGIVQTSLAQGLTGTDGIAVIDPLSLNGRLKGALGTDRPIRDARLHRLLRKQRIDLLVDGRIDLDDQGHRLVSHLVDPASGEVRFTTQVLVRDESEIPDKMREVSARLLSFAQVEILRVEESRDLGSWITSWDRDVEAIRSFLLASRYAHRFEPGARRHLQRAVEIDPNFIAPRVWLLASLVQAGEMAEAEKHHRHLLLLESGASPFEQAMIAWSGAFLRGDLPEQERHLEIAMGYSPDNFILLVNLAGTRYELGDPEGSVTAIMPAIRAGWGFPAAYAIAGKSLVMLGRNAEAFDVLERGLAVSPVDPEVYGLLQALSIWSGDPAASRRYGDLLQSRVAETNSRVRLVPILKALADKCESSGDSGCAGALRGLVEQSGEAHENKEAENGDASGNTRAGLS